MIKLLKITVLGLFYLLLFSQATTPIQATQTSKVGVHILHPDEVVAAKELVSISSQPDTWQYVTIPFTYEDAQDPDRWQAFFWQAKQAKIIPIVRLATEVEGGAWIVPDRRQIVNQIAVLSKLEWPTAQKHIIAYNEVNHAKEWGGTIDPEQYAEYFKFVSNWAHTENQDFVVLPAAMDLAAPNGVATMEAFGYLNKLYAYDPEIFSYADAWNSHSYANPGFSASPQRTGQNSMRGFEHELAFLKQKTGRDFNVYITETGWENSAGLQPWLSSYYEYATQHIWSHPQVVAVTPFLLKGAPGPFSGFSFLDESNRPTAQYVALQAALQKMYDPAQQLSSLSE